MGLFKKNINTDMEYILTRFIDRFQISLMGQAKLMAEINGHEEGWCKLTEEEYEKSKHKLWLLDKTDYYREQFTDKLSIYDSTKNNYNMLNQYYEDKYNDSDISDEEFEIIKKMYECLNGMIKIVL